MISRRKTIGTLCDEVARQGKAAGTKAVRKTAKAPAGAKPSKTGAGKLYTVGTYNERIEHMDYKGPFRSFEEADSHARGASKALSDAHELVIMEGSPGRPGIIVPGSRKYRGSKAPAAPPKKPKAAKAPKDIKRGKKLWVEKSTGANPWWLKGPREGRPDWPETIRGFKTQRQAVRYMRMLESWDKEAGRAWYREEIAKLSKEQPGVPLKDIWRQAGRGAASDGIPPALIGANPDTGEPL